MLWWSRDTESCASHTRRPRLQCRRDADRRCPALSLSIRPLPCLLCIYFLVEADISHTRSNCCRLQQPTRGRDRRVIPAAELLWNGPAGSKRGEKTEEGLYTLDGFCRQLSRLTSTVFFFSFFFFYRWVYHFSLGRLKINFWITRERKKERKKRRGSQNKNKSAE